MTRERTPKTPRSIVRNHSPYCESTGPIVQEGFVAARIRALQSFSAQAPKVTHSHSPFTPCPPHWPHVYKLHSPPRSSLAPKEVLTGTDMRDTGTIKRFHSQLLSEDNQNLVSATGSSARFLGSVHSFQPREQQSSSEPTAPSRSYIRGKGAGNASANLFKDVVPSPRAQSNQDVVTASNVPYCPLSQIDKVDDKLAESSLSSEKSILSPHAIQADRVEPQAIWTFLPHIEDRNNDYIHEQALKPRGSIADKLDSMVERGWVGSETLREIYKDDEVASHSTGSKIQIRGTRLDSRSYSLDEMRRPQKLPSCSKSISVSTSESLSESQRSTGQDAASHTKQKDPKMSVYEGSQKRRERQGKRSPAANTPQRSSSDIGIHHLKIEPATPTGDRRAWTLHHLGGFSSNRSLIQPEVSPSVCRTYAWDRRSIELDPGSTKSPSSREGLKSKSGSDQTMIRDEQVGQDSMALSTITGSRHASANTKDLARSASWPTSFLKKFPWYKVTLVDKQPVTHSLVKGSDGDDRTSGVTRGALQDPNADQIELSKSVSKSRPPVEFGQEEGENIRKMESLQYRGPIDQQTIDATALYHKASSQPFPQLMKSPREKNKRPSPEHAQSATKCSQDFYAANLNLKDEQLSRDPHQVVEQMIGHAQSPAGTGPLSTKPRDLSQSGSVEASFESPIVDGVFQSLQPQGSEVKEHSRMQSYTPPHATLPELRANNRLANDSSGCETARIRQEVTARPSLSRQPRSELVNLTSKRLEGGSNPLPASIHRSDQHGPVHREVKGGGKGIKKIQVTVTFDGAEDLVIEATLGKRDRQEHWRTTG